MKPTSHRILPWRRKGQYVSVFTASRSLSCTVRRSTIRSIEVLPDRIRPSYNERLNATLLALQWPSPPRNILVTKKKRTPGITESLVEYVNHLHSTYPSMNIILEPDSAAELHDSLPFSVYTYEPARYNGTVPLLAEKTDLVCTLGGDGTILRASSLFAHSPTVPPVLSFAMGTIGFLGEWKFKEYKRAFREVYMSGASDAYAQQESSEPDISPSRLHMLDNSASTRAKVSYADIRGKSMGSQRPARILLRNRLRVGVFSPDGTRINSRPSSASSLNDVAQNDSNDGDTFALNEVIIHRGPSPHLKIIDILINNRPLTEGVADGLIVSTPTGSTAYSLSAGGSIVHPLVPSLLLTPICPRSLSFRPLVLPANTPITLRLSDKNRGREVEVSIDGKRLAHAAHHQRQPADGTERKGDMGVGMEVRVLGEEVRDPKTREWVGGVPSVVRGTAGGWEEAGGEEVDHWVGGLNALLKFNYAFGEREDGR